MTSFKTPEPDLQIAFYSRLMEIRKTYLVEALLECVEKLDISRIDSELKKFATNRSLQRLAGWGLRGGSLNTLGAEATQRIFDLIHEIVKPKVEKSGKRRIDVVNAAGRSVRIEIFLVITDLGE